MNTTKTILTVLAFSIFGISLNAQVWNAITDFTADLPEYQTGFTLTNNLDSISAVGSDATGNSFYLYFDNGGVDMSALLNPGATAQLIYTDTNSAVSSYTLSLEDYDAGTSWALSGFSMADSTIFSTDNGSGSSDLTNISGIGLNTGGLTGAGVNMTITGFQIVPEPSSAALLAGMLALGSVMLRRRAA
jgi:hypothetical protein